MKPHKDFIDQAIKNSIISGIDIKIKIIANY